MRDFMSTMNMFRFLFLLLPFSIASYLNAEPLWAYPGYLWHEALLLSNELQADSLLVLASAERLSASGRLPDPMLRFGYSPHPLETRNGPVDYTLTISQKIPWPGSMTASRREMEQLHQISEVESEIEALELRTEITALWGRMYLTRQEITLLTDKMQRLAHLTEIANVRYRSDQASLETLLLLENRSVMTESRRMAAELLLQSQRAELSSILGYEDFQLAWPDSVPAEDYFLESAAIVPLMDSMPRIRRSRLISGARYAAADAAAAGAYPSFEVGATWSMVGEPEIEMGAVDPGEDGLMVFAGLNLPLGYSGTGSRSNAAFLSAGASDYMLQQTTADRIAERTALVNRLTALADMLVVYRETVIPNYEAIYELSITRWISSTGDVERVIENLGDLEDARLEETRIYAEIVSVYAELMQLDGRTTEKGEFL
ncbi:MAG: hypothetical protein GF388_06900 [Candidatus Aegiribacteria sp.]|nr:hypothetical protein [Candidatus Aegiribacteria sp.]MBD3294874.1 hypothetical protein [Candidatus Fermentibacteria bacterium]